MKKKTGSEAKSKAKMIAIPCLVSPGMFSTERQVVIKLPDGQEIDALVDHRSVVVKQKLQTGKPVSGFVNVSLVHYDKQTKQALIDLPQGSFITGPRIRVPSKMVQAA
ncbi:MAG: hypothetical protein ACREQN_02160 [Candidatus Binataceae bacterium]